MIDSKKKQYNFVDTLVNNIDYMNKSLVKENIKTFMGQYHSFNPIEAVRENGGVIFSFIELNGFIECGDCLQEMLIGVPKNFPQIAPVFLIALNRQMYRVNREQQLLKLNHISLEKNERGEDYVRLCYPFVTSKWQPRMTLTDTFNEIKRAINNPILLTSLVSNQRPQNNRNIEMAIGNAQNQNQKGPKIEFKELKKTVDEKSIDIVNTISILGDLQSKEKGLEFTASRNHFLSEHLPKLSEGLVKKSNMIAVEKSNMEKLVNKSMAKNECDDLLEVTAKDHAKIEAMAEKDALKEAEWKIKQSIESEVGNGYKKYSDYKKVVRTLFDKMYDNQTELLINID